MFERLTFKNMRIRNKLLIAYISLATPLLLFGTLTTLHLFKQAIQTNIESELQNSTKSILSMVRTTASASIKNYLRAAAEKNLDISRNIFERYRKGKISRAEAIRQIRDVLLSQVIGETGYIYCINSKGVAVVHPNRAVEGNDYSHFRFIQEQIRLKTGYIEYNWKNPGEPKERPKALYMSYFEPLDWIISVSSYREEFATLINVDDFRDGVLSFRFGDSGYAYIADEKGNAIIHPYLKKGYNIFAAENETGFFEEMQKRSAGTIRYHWKNPSEQIPREKLVTFGKIPEYGWIVASSSYTSETFSPLESLRNLILGVSLPLVTLFFLLTFGISAHLTMPIRTLIDKFKSGVEGDLSVRLENPTAYEFSRLAEYFNSFMQRIEDYQSNLESEIRERRETQDALKKSEEKYRLLTENISDVIWMLDMDLNYTYVSPAAKQLHGWSAEQIRQMKLDQVLPPRSLETATQVVAEELEAGAASGDYHRSKKLELELNRSDGTTVWSEITATFIVDESGEPTGILGVARNIADRKTAEAENIQLQEKLARSKKMEALGLLAGGVAHDLNNVLSGIVSYPDLLLLDLPEDNPMRAAILTIRESGHKAASIVQDLLTLARRGVISTEIINLNDIVADSLNAPEHKKLLSFHPDIRLDVQLEDNLPNICGSAIHLKKSLMNLLSNATEAQQGGGHIVIATESRYLDRAIRGYEDVVQGEYVVLSVRDFGEGIHESDIARIFEPFYTKKVMGRSGTGLGMAVVWGTVQDHRGYIDVISSVGEGATFELYFPLTREIKGQGGISPDLNTYTGCHESILVVDDIKEQREISAKMLNRLNYNVFTVSSGEKAVEFLKSNPVDLVILDMIMEPGMDGLETFKAIREFNPEQKVIIASGYAETERVKDALQHGAGFYLKKPYTLERLGIAVKKAINTENSLGMGACDVSD